MVNDVDQINAFNQHSAQLVLGSVLDLQTAKPSRYVTTNHPTRSTQPFTLRRTVNEYWRL